MFSRIMCTCTHVEGTEAKLYLHALAGVCVCGGGGGGEDVEKDIPSQDPSAFLTEILSGQHPFKVCSQPALSWRSRQLDSHLLRLSKRHWPVRPHPPDS